MIVVLSTYPDRKSAGTAAAEIVERELAACVSVIRIENSVYRWEGKIVKKPEYLLLIKSTARIYSRLEAYIKRNHPHHVPEIIYLEAKGGQKDYLGWVESNARLLSVPLDFSATRRLPPRSARKPSTSSR